MTQIHHVNCGTLLVPNFPTVVCHCLLLEDETGLALVDTGIGLLDVQKPVERLGQQLIDMAGFQFNEHDTAVRRIEQLGFSPDDVHHIVMTHCDPDHAGGLADFPNAQVHLAEEELSYALSGHWRYIPRQFEHKPHWQTYDSSHRDNDQWRQSSLSELRRMLKDHGDEIQMTGYHDITELPECVAGNL